MSHKWDENTTLRFVEEYRQHECLWNAHYGFYKNKQARKTPAVQLPTQ